MMKMMQPAQKTETPGCATHVLVGIVILVGFFLVITWFSQPPNSNQPKPRPWPHPGEIWEVVELTLMPLTEQANDELIKLSVAKDESGVQMMIMQGRALVVPASTKVRIIATRWDHSEVRILDGTYIGESGWILSQDLKYVRGSGQ